MKTSDTRERYVKLRFFSLPVINDCKYEETNKEIEAKTMGWKNILHF